MKMDIKNQSYGDVLVVSPVGRIDHATTEDFRSSLGRFVDRCRKGGESLILDLAGIDYVSSAGLRSFMLANKQAKTQGGVIVVAAMQPVVKEIFEISRFTLIFQTFDDVRGAIDSLSIAQPKTRQS
ncbi:MAG: STAS domain-containing protein [Betaproteobacteria bacterium]